MPNETGFMTATTSGQELLNGSGLVLDEVTAAPTDTNVAHLTMRAQVSGATVILYVFDKVSGVWRSRTLT